MPSLRQSSTSRLSLGLRLATVALLGSVFSNTSHAQTITFQYNCNCSNSNMGMASNLGERGGDVVPMGTVNSDVAGFTQPVPIDNGLLQWMSSPCTGTYSDPPARDATYGIIGGKASITGAVFGLPQGSTLFTASFRNDGGAHLGFVSLRTTGDLNVSYVNPALLQNLGLNGYPNHGQGTLSDYVDWYGDTIGVTVTVTLGPEGAGSSPREAYDSSGSPPATDKPASNFQVLHNFTGGGDGGFPVAAPILDPAGNLYGTTEQGGLSNGTVFRMKQAGSGWTLNPLFSFTGGDDGAQPAAALTLGPGGTLYGTASTGGANGDGTVFSLNPPPHAPPNILAPWNETVLTAFGDSDASPYGNLIFDQAGNIYGTTLFDVFELTPDGSGGWTRNVLYSFGYNGGISFGGVVMDGVGNLYGTTWGGGNSDCSYGSGCGTVFELKPSGGSWTYNLVYAFQGNDGEDPAGGLVMDAMGNLYGTTNNGGTAYSGTVFKLSPSGGGWTFSTIYNFTGGGQPWGNLVVDSAGNLYGTTYSNVNYGPGAVFKLTPGASGWTETDLHIFSGADGAYPYAGVALGKDGSLYGTAAYGGSDTCGVVFKLTP